MSAIINDHSLLDTRSMHNFIFEDKGKHLALKVTIEGGTMKAVSSLTLLWAPHKVRKY